MEQYFERLRKKLLEIYNVENLDSDKLYEMILSENKEQQIHSNVGEMLEKYKLYDFNNPILDSDNFYNLVSRSLRNREKLIESFEWKAFQKDKLENKILNNQNFLYKIYLSVPNECLEQFAMRLLANCVSKKVDYDFKINNNSNINRSDNVVIYATDENYQKYIDVIHEVLKSPGLKTNNGQQHLLAFPYDEDISVAPYIDQKGESFSSIVCNNICRLKNQSSNFEDFYFQVSEMLKNCFRDMNLNNEISHELNNIKAR